MNSHDEMPSSPRWCLRASVPGRAASVDVRERVHRRVLELPTWRAAVVRSDSSAISVTCSSFGATRTDALADCVQLLASLELPERAVQLELADSQVYESEALLFPMIVGLAEVAEILGVSKQYVSEEAKKQTGWLPGPVARVKATPLWLRDEIVAVAEARINRQQIADGGPAIPAGGRIRRANRKKADVDSDDMLGIGDEIAIDAARYLEGPSTAGWGGRRHGGSG